MDFLAIEMIPMQNFVKAIDKRFTDDKSFKSLFEVPNTTKEKKERFGSRQKQILLAKERGEKHLGGKQTK